MIIYLSFIFVIIVLLLNLLIAQMSNTYNTILNEAQYALLLNRAWIVARVEHNSFCGLLLLYIANVCATFKVTITIVCIKHIGFINLMSVQSCRHCHSDNENPPQGSGSSMAKRYLKMRSYVSNEDVDPQGMNLLFSMH